MLAEALTFGPQMLLGFGQWILVYGLIVYLPVRAFAPRNRPSPKRWHYPLAVVLPVVVSLPFIAVVALALAHEH
jgi:hypothetical protein